MPSIPSAFLLPNARVILAEAENPARKTRYDLVAVEKAVRENARLSNLS
ncbi:MAG: hypothetical protein SPL86_08255 [Succiniclasticum sp.]|nr:hypothetical protein [Succiniclasticum sp.]MDY6291460.1 hypothetical protein [Succiniclasticum sp.]